MAIDRHGRIEPRELEREMSTSYLDYAMSVIVGRALPDVRDGLKPVHRRVLYAMHDMGLQPDRPYVKSANIVGRVMGEFHPHGDSAIYDTLVRLAQDFASRYPLVDGQGNFGSSEFAAAAMRYTEARLSRMAVEMLRDIDEDTVDDAPTYDDRRTEPVVLPSRVPNLLINGSSGIAVGMATNIPPHNVGETIDAVVATIDDPDIEVEGLMRHIKAPDFPTGGIIVGRAGVVDAYRTGRGRVVVRGRAHNEPLKHGRNAIVFTELPYQVNKAELIRKMADLANDKVIPEIADLRDESGRDGVRVVIELRRDAVPMVVLNKLYKHTAVQTTFGVNAIALVDGVPRTLGLKEIIRHYLDHQKEVVTRRSRYRLARAEARAHILEGLLKALGYLDEVIALIRAAADPETARTGLMTRFDLTEIQARAILDLRLQRLTQLEAGKIQAEYDELQKRIAELRAILGDERRVYALIREELLEIRGRFADERRTEIVPGEGDIDLEDLIAEEEMVISISNAGYLKRLPVTTYRAQGRGGKGLRGAKLKDDDYIEHLFIASTHHYLLFFTSTGKVYRQKVHELPQGSRDSRGRHIANVLALQPGEEVRAVFATRDYGEGRYLVLATRDGMVKKTELRQYDTVLRERGLTAIQLQGDDELVGVQLTDGDEDLLVVSARGQAARFHESQVRPMGRDTRGVRAMNLDGDDRVLAICVARDDEDLLVVTGYGYGKRTPMPEYPTKGRPTKGVRTIKVSDRKGELVTARPVREGHELLLISQNGQVIRIQAGTVRRTGRSTEGVRLMNLPEDDRVSGVASVVEPNGEDAGGGGPDGSGPPLVDEAALGPLGDVLPDGPDGGAGG
ncbi:DNA gyrase subunit A [Miltoncostaea marina]|uniref:DNA gyrase subunit A n=1 Tax=Miltoncostaea marina TaxID=2843215 RepID=UPI001FEAAE7E|nr:DNA gyrase subunit A [Miltoncostaea marina]